MRYSQLNAPIVYSGLGTAQQDACVVVQHQGEDYRQDAQAQIVFVGNPSEAAANFPNAQVMHLDKVALCPALVNAHTHLDLSTLPFQESGYTEFIVRVIANRAERGLAAAKQGLASIQRGGVQVIGDIVTDEATMRWLLQQPDMQGVAYWEVFSLDPSEAEQVFADTVAKLREFRQLEQPHGMRVGISPHTPHTVSAPLLQKLAALAKQNAIPMQIHVAESPAELALHRGEGELLQSLGPFLPADWQPSGTTPVRYLQQLGILEAEPTLVHMVHVEEEEVQMVQKAGCAVVHCPRSNLALQCGVFPWQLYQQHAVDVALGTDSSGSAPSLNIRDEFIAAQRMHPQVSRLELVRAVVKAGHRALKLKPAQLIRGTNASALQRLPLI